MRNLALAAMAAATLCMAPARAQEPMTERNIAIVTEGEVQVVPDIAVLHAGVVSEGKTAAEALAQNKPALNRLIEAAREAGIAPSDIRSSQVSLNPRMTQPPPAPAPRPRAASIDGYEARTSITVTIRDVAKAGPLVDAFAKAGANQMGGLSFGLADESQARDAARRKAAEAARKRALLYAEALGVELGELVSATEPEAALRPFGGGFADMPMPRRAAALAASPLAVEPGEITVGASLQSVWRIGAAKR